MKIKSIKKSLAVVLCAVILLISGTFACFATNNSYTISEINDMTLFLPDNMTAITRSSKADDKYFSLFGLNYDTTMQNFKSSDIYLQGMDSNSDVTVTVTMTKTSESEGIVNYNLLNSTELTQVKENFLAQGEYSSCTPDNAKQIVWLIFDTTVNNNGKTINAYQANTVYDGMSINVTLQRNEGNVKASDYQTFYSIVSSANFMKAESSDISMIFAIIMGAVIVIVLIILIILIIKKLARRIKKNKNDRIIEELSDKYTTRRKRYRYTEEEPTESNKEDYRDFLGDAVSEEVIEQPEQIEVNEFEEYESDEVIEVIEETEEIAETEATNETEKEAVAEELEEENDYFNDEELVRMEAKKTKFVDSDDFFEEAPKKTMGVIISKAILEAEDYDVIKEVEKKAIAVEKPAPKKGEAVTKAFKSIGGGIKSFFVHCGYFCTNVSRMIKRRNAMKKRQKAEEERRQKARMKAAKQRQQRREIQDKGLVQVRKRNEQKRPDSRNQRNRR